MFHATSLIKLWSADYVSHIFAPTTSSFPMSWHVSSDWPAYCELWTVHKVELGHISKSWWGSEREKLGRRPGSLCCHPRLSYYVTDSFGWKLTRMVSLGFVGIFTHSPETSQDCLSLVVLSSLPYLHYATLSDSRLFKDFSLFIM